MQERNVEQSREQMSESIRCGRVLMLGSFRGDDDLRQVALEVCRSAAEHTGDSRRRPGLPRVVIVVGSGSLALLASFYRVLSRRSLLFVYLGEPPQQPWTRLRSFVLKRADNVLVHGDATRAAIAHFDKVTYRIKSKDVLDHYLKASIGRSPELVRRIIVVGALTPGSGAFDLLAALAAWAELNPSNELALSWVGEGDFSALLAAQPLPDNLSQTFHGEMEDPELASLFERGDLLAVPCVADTGRSHVTQALAAGLPVLGSLRSSAVRRHVTNGSTGWLFDPLRPGEMLDAIACALTTSDDRLSEMRPRARAAMSAPSGMSIARAERGSRHQAVRMHVSTRAS